MSFENNKKIGYIGLFRSLMNWEYVDDDAVFSCFIKLLLSVNFQDKTWHGQTVKRGSIIGSIESLCMQLHIKRDKLKRCLKVLQDCGAIKVEMQPNKYHIITVINYEKYQCAVSGKNTNRATNKTINKTDNSTANNSVNNPTTTKKDKKYKNGSADVCATSTHTSAQKEKETVAAVASPLRGEPAAPPKKEPDIEWWEWNTYFQEKTHQSAIEAEQMWINRYDNGKSFSEKAKRELREWLKSNGFARKK